jgi:hypothetical protein
MSEDIVNRLRNLCITGDNMWEVDVCGAMSEAADEIERLRKEVNTWMDAAERFAESDPKFDAWVYYFKARRSE